jgi:hypothetical protein
VWAKELALEQGAAVVSLFRLMVWLNLAAESGCNHDYRNFLDRMTPLFADCRSSLAKLLFWVQPRLQELFGSNDTTVCRLSQQLG